jgi:hypothetical protein
VFFDYVNACGDSLDCTVLLEEGIVLLFDMKRIQIYDIPMTSSGRRTYRNRNNDCLASVMTIISRGLGVPIIVKLPFRKLLKTETRK